jgi:hypothetical protein
LSQGHDQGVDAGARRHRDVGVVETAHADLRREPPLPLARGHHGLPQPVGRARDRRRRLDSLRRLHLGRRPLGQPQVPQGQGGVHPGELLDRGVGRHVRAEGAERAAVVLVAITQEAHVVADAVGARLGSEHALEQWLGLVVLLPGEIGDTEQVEDRQTVRGPAEGALERLHREIGSTLGQANQARVIEGVDVVGIELQGLLQAGQRVFIALVLVGEDRLGDEDVGLRLLRGGVSAQAEGGREGGREQSHTRHMARQMVGEMKSSGQGV